MIGVIIQKHINCGKIGDLSSASFTAEHNTKNRAKASAKNKEKALKYYMTIPRSPNSKPKSPEEIEVIVKE